ALLLHHPGDALVPLAEGERARDALLVQNRLAAAVPSAPAPHAGFTCRRYGSGDAMVLWCLHHDSIAFGGRFYPHQWPDGAGAAIMDFFERVDRAAPPSS